MANSIGSDISPSSPVSKKVKTCWLDPTPETKVLPSVANAAPTKSSDLSASSSKELSSVAK